jgi:hypothetical protein
MAWGGRSAPGSVAGDTGQEAFYRYAAARYHPCTPAALFNAAPRWKDIVLCMQSRADVAPDVAIIGDSHAEQLFPGLAEALPSHNVVYYIQHAAPIMGQHGFDAIFSHVVATPGIRYVVVVVTWDVHRREMPPGSSQARELLAVIDNLTRAGKTVYVTDDVPSFPFDANTCKRYRWFGWKKCEIGAPVDRQHYASDVTALAQAIAGRTDVRMLATRRYFCDDAVCSMIRGGRLLYRDDNHLNLEGSRLIGSEIVTDNDGVFAR